MTKINAGAIIAGTALSIVTMFGALGADIDGSSQVPLPEHATVAPGPYAEDHPLFDCRIDGNRQCGPKALVPVPDSGGVLRYVPWTEAPAATWRIR